MALEVSWRKDQMHSVTAAAHGSVPPPQILEPKWLSVGALAKPETGFLKETFRSLSLRLLIDFPSWKKMEPIGHLSSVFSSPPTI